MGFFQFKKGAICSKKVKRKKKKNSTLGDICLLLLFFVVFVVFLLFFPFYFIFPMVSKKNHGQHTHPNADEVATENGRMVESLCEIAAEALDRLSRLAGTV